MAKHLDKHGINVTTQQVFKYVNSAENDIWKAVHELKVSKEANLHSYRDREREIVAERECICER